MYKTDTLMTFEEYLQDSYGVGPWPTLPTIDDDDKNAITEYFRYSYVSLPINEEKDYLKWRQFLSRELSKYYPKYKNDKDILKARFEKELFYERTYNTSGDNTTSSNNSSSTDNSSLHRNLTYQYPESNYQDGVLPYDLDSVPNVEFISTQNDAKGKSNSVTNGLSDSEGKYNQKSSYSPEYEKILDTYINLQYNHFAKLAEHLEKLFRVVELL